MRQKSQLWLSVGLPDVECAPVTAKTAAAQQASPKARARDTQKQTSL
jgi:hypothetical protein